MNQRRAGAEPDEVRGCPHVAVGEPDPCDPCWEEQKEEEERARHFCGDPSCCDQGDTVNPIPWGLRR